jgi:uncharacterized membrane-anchored protein YjiN (DUF445 family)
MILNKILFYLFIFTAITLSSQASEKISEDSVKAEDRRGIAGNTKRDSMRKRPHDRDRSLRSMMQKLQLDDKQREISKKLMKEMMEEQKEIHESIKTLMKKMEQLRSDDNVNQEELIRVGSELGGLKIKISLCMHNFFKNLKPHLNEDQLKSLESIREELQQRRRQHQGKGRRIGGEGRDKKTRQKD